MGQFKPSPRPAGHSILTFNSGLGNLLEERHDGHYLWTVAEVTWKQLLWEAPWVYENGFSRAVGSHELVWGRRTCLTTVESCFRDFIVCIYDKCKHSWGNVPISMLDQGKLKWFMNPARCRCGLLRHTHCQASWKAASLFTWFATKIILMQSSWYLSHNFYNGTQFLWKVSLLLLPLPPTTSLALAPTLGLQFKHIIYFSINSI